MKYIHALARVVGLTAFVFGLLSWVYVVVIQVTHPHWLYGPLAHLHIFPFRLRLDDFGIAGFAIAAIGFMLWQSQLNVKPKQRY